MSQNRNKIKKHCSPGNLLQFTTPNFGRKTPRNLDEGKLKKKTRIPDFIWSTQARVWGFSSRWSFQIHREIQPVLSPPSICSSACKNGQCSISFHNFWFMALFPFSFRIFCYSFLFLFVSVPFLFWCLGPSFPLSSSDLPFYSCSSRTSRTWLAEKWRWSSRTI